MDLLVVDLRDEIAGENLDIAFQKPLFEGALNAGVVAGEDLVEALDECDLQRRASVIAVAGDLAGGLDAGEPGTADDHLCRVVLCCLLAGRTDCLVNLAGVVEALHRQRVFFKPIDAEESSRAADAHEQVVVVDGLAVAEFNGSVVGVDTGNAVADKVRLGRFDLVNRDRYLRFGLWVADDAVGLVEDEVVVVFRDPRQFGLPIVDLVFERLYRPGTGVAGPDNDDVRCHTRYSAVRG